MAVDSDVRHTESCGASTGVNSLREFFTLWINRLEEFYIEQDRRYEARFRAVEEGTAEKFRAAETAVAAALVGQDKSVTAAFAASEKAIVKAEDAQRDYNSSQKREIDTQIGVIRDDVSKLRKSRDEVAGARSEAIDIRAAVFGIFGVAGVVAAAVVAFVSR